MWDFEVIDVLADMLGTTVEEKKFKGCYGRGIIGGEKVLLLKPQTFMNLSGESIRGASDFYKVDHEHIVSYMMISAWMWGSCASAKGKRGRPQRHKEHHRPPGYPGILAH